MTTFEKIKKEYETILQQLSNPELVSDWEKFEELNQKKKKLEIIIEKQKELDEIKKQIEENKAILGAGEDQELVTLAETDNIQLQEKQKVLQEFEKFFSS